MIRDIMRDPLFLSQKSEMAMGDDMQVAEDLKDTLRANSRTCVGMAANMIGIKKQVIVVSLGLAPMVLFNPKIVKRSGEYETEEGCLSLEGLRKVKRYRKITVEYLDREFKKQRQEFTGFIAQNVQDGRIKKEGKGASEGKGHCGASHGEIHQ